MTLRTRYWIFGGLLALLALAALIWWWYARVPNTFPLDRRDHIASWTLESIYANNPQGAEKARAEAARLVGLIGNTSDAFTDYDEEVGIAQNYEQLGDGKSAYEWLERAIKDGPETGLAYANLGELMARLGAFYTAKAAYEKAVEVEPKYIQYRLSELEFLTGHFATDTAELESAFGAAYALGASRDVDYLKSEWLRSIGSTTRR